MYDIYVQVLRFQPSLAEHCKTIDENGDGKVTWGEFWHFFSTGELFATDEQGLEVAYDLLHVWEEDH